MSDTLDSLIAQPPAAQNFIMQGLGGLADPFIAAMKERQRKQILQSLPMKNGQPDYSAATFQLLQNGDMVGAQTLAGLGSHERDYALKERMASPQYHGEVQRATLAAQNEFAPKTTNVKLPSGEEVTVEKGPNGYRLPTIAGQPTEQNNPFSFGKQTEAQSKDSTYANRLFEAEKVLRGVEGAGTDRLQRVAGWASDKIGYNLRNPEYQKFDQAQRDFINATLRRESGAVISDSEFNNARQQYLPQPGDTPELLAQKKANRVQTIRGIAGGGGPSYHAPYNFDAQGGMVQRAPATPMASPAPQVPGVPGAAPGAAPAALPPPGQNGGALPPGTNPTQVVAEARAAIARGAPREAVIDRLRRMGVAAPGL